MNPKLYAHAQRAIVALGISCNLALSACASGQHTIPPPLHAEIVCPQGNLRHPMSTCGAGGGGTGFSPDLVNAQEYGNNGIASTGVSNTSNTLEADGSATDSSGSPAGTSSATITSDVNDGTDTLNLNAPSLGNPTTLTFTDGAYVDPTITSQTFDNGQIAVNYDPTNDVATSTFQAAGITWNLSGTTDPDGFYMDVNVSGSDGETQYIQIPYNQLVPSVYDATTTLSTSIKPMETGWVSIQGCQSPCGKMPPPGSPVKGMVVLSGVLFVGGTGAMFFPGGQPVGAGLMWASNALAIGAGVIAVSDHNQKKKSNSKH